MTTQPAEPTRHELEQALEAARARLENLGERSSELNIQAGPEQGNIADAPTGSHELLEEIAELERALGTSGTARTAGNPGDVRH